MRCAVQPTLCQRMHLEIAVASNLQRYLTNQNIVQSLSLYQNEQMYLCMHTHHM